MKNEFSAINQGYNNTFTANKLSIGLVVPLENYANSAVPTMAEQVARIQLAEQLGFSAVWLRDVPFNVPSFGDAGQVFDPFVYIGLLAAQTSKITLGVASMVLPLRHPAHVAKAAASVDILSEGRLVLGVASGDRPEEYPALNLPFENRGDKFRQSVEYIKSSWQTNAEFNNEYGNVNGGIDLIPKPVNGRFPMLITGGSQQDDKWLAENGDGWMLYPKNLELQQHLIKSWRQNTVSAGRSIKPAMQPLYIDLVEDNDQLPQPIHLGFSLGVNALKDYLLSLEKIGMNHVALNLRFNQLPIETTLEMLAKDVLPLFEKAKTT